VYPLCTLMNVLNEFLFCELAVLYMFDWRKHIFPASVRNYRNCVRKTAMLGWFC